MRIEEVEGFCCLCSENKVADQLGGYHAADLCLCFRICIKFLFLMMQLKFYDWFTFVAGIKDNSLHR